MNVISSAAELLNWVLSNSATGLQTFLEANFFVVAYCIRVIQCLRNNVSEMSVFIVEVLQNCYLDFIAFTNELALSIYIIFNIILKFLTKVLSNTYFGFSYTLDVISSLYFNIKVTFFHILCSLLMIAESITYFVKLIFAAFLLILQLGPNLILFCYDAILDYSTSFFITLQSTVFSLINHLHNLHLEFCANITGIPPKAYFGIVILIIICYHYRIIGKFLKSYILLLLLFLSFLISRICCNLKIILTHLLNLFSQTISALKMCCTKCFVQMKRSNVGSICHQNIQWIMNAVKLFNNCVQKIVIFIKFPFFTKNNEILEDVQHLQQELYAEREKHLCVVCHDRERNTILFPCRHMCLCEECTLTIQLLSRGCPLCRMSILKVIHVYT